MWTYPRKSTSQYLNAPWLRNLRAKLNTDTSRHHFQRLETIEMPLENESMKYLNRGAILQAVEQLTATRILEPFVWLVAEDGSYESVVFPDVPQRPANWAALSSGCWPIWRATWSDPA
jgi:hypothetical protein